LAPHESGVKTILLQQCGVTSLLDGPPLLHDNNQIGIADRGKPVRDDYCRATPPQPAERDLNGRLAFGVESACCLIQQQDPRVAQQRAGECDPLPLSTG
jgi:hypothetical protein